MTETRKVIGIPGWNSSDGSYFGGGLNHLEFINTFGNARIIMPWEEKVDVDLLYLPGGLDVAPSSYGAVPGFKTSNQDVMKQFFFNERLENYIDNTPIFGVCLGMQMLGVYFGSKLTQHLSFHEQSDTRWKAAHSVTVRNPNVDEDDRFDVNSHHHQCILESELADVLEVSATAECDEPYREQELIVEAFRHKELPIVGVQWHPEELYDMFSMDAITELLYD